ncbi:Dbl homology domain-containing protein [Dactylonectria estremocensis]|uniref:Dbl homology domain-containing protein n=1 Tax=Dactylonectria estremocensis TaxID=1079267 RepID=A0A9P9IP85_9HYPO|nr:Dbl homology domain-containing protein [Dactylonectria estremocensis]
MRYTIPTHPPLGTAVRPIPNAAQSSLETSPTTSHDISVEISGPISSTPNTINPTASGSHYVHKICVALIHRLAQVPNLEPFLQGVDENDSVNSLWNLFRDGHPLLTIYNSTQPKVMLGSGGEDWSATVAENAESAIFEFTQACRDELEVPPSDRFLVSDLVGNNISHLIKAIHVINYHVLDLAERRGYLKPLKSHVGKAPPGIPNATSLNPIVRELIATEEMYLNSLTDLQSLRETLTDMGVVPSDTIHQTFLNIEEIIDCHRRFLEHMRLVNGWPTSQQKWGTLFSEFEDKFAVYYPFFSNRRVAFEAINRIFNDEELSKNPRAEASRRTLLIGKDSYKYILQSAMQRPLSRMAKYPVVLRDMIKRVESEDMKANLIAGRDAVERVLEKINKIVEEDLSKVAFEDLMSRMEDWKRYNVEQFGKLLLYGTFKITTTTAVGSQKDYKVYLFERILICCKEIRDEAKGTERKGSGENTKLRLKGRVFTTNMVNIEHTSMPDFYNVVVWWAGEFNMKDCFTIKFTNAAVMERWADQLEHQRKEALIESRREMPRYFTYPRLE